MTALVSGFNGKDYFELTNHLPPGSWLVPFCTGIHDIPPSLPLSAAQHCRRSPVVLLRVIAAMCQLQINRAQDRRRTSAALSVIYNDTSAGERTGASISSSSR